jgi:hypothetical protein
MLDDDRTPDEVLGEIRLATQHWKQATSISQENDAAEKFHHAFGELDEYLVNGGKLPRDWRMAVRNLERDPDEPATIYYTKAGKPITDEMIEEWAAEAERGYEVPAETVSHTLGRHPHQADDPYRGAQLPNRFGNSGPGGPTEAPHYDQPHIHGHEHEISTLTPGKHTHEHSHDWAKIRHSHEHRHVLPEPAGKHQSRTQLALSPGDVPGLLEDVEHLIGQIREALQPRPVPASVAVVNKADLLELLQGRNEQPGYDTAIGRLLTAAFGLEERSR